MNIVLQLFLALGGIVAVAFFWIFVVAWAFTMNGWSPDDSDTE